MWQVRLFMLSGVPSHDFVYIETLHVLCVSLCIFDFTWVSPSSLFWMLFPSFPMISPSAISPGPASKRPKESVESVEQPTSKLFRNFTVGCFQKKRYPQNGWFIIENPIKMDDLGNTRVLILHFFPIFSSPKAHCRSWSPFSHCRLRAGGSAWPHLMRPKGWKTCNADETYGTGIRSEGIIRF